MVTWLVVPTKIPDMTSTRMTATATPITESTKRARSATRFLTATINGSSLLP
ncbi:Uncharacterised protein [Mycobacteroides abscessus subsp. abscessus]|nr:Uncharacterised protein [Mycobacteroides abscessus subsp. abscessus]